MNQENRKIVMFDFDGVLVNTHDSSFEIHKRKNPHFTWERFQSYSDGNFMDGYLKAVKDGEHIPTENFPEQYHSNLITLSVHDILSSVVQALAEKYLLVVISSSNGTAIKNFLEKENIVNYFVDILGTDVHLSKIVKINSVLSKYHTEPSSAVFITDTLGDIKEADECRVSSIGVTWGLHGRDRLAKGNPVAIIDDPRELYGAIVNVLK